MNLSCERRPPVEPDPSVFLRGRRRLAGDNLSEPLTPTRRRRSQGMHLFMALLLIVSLPVCAQSPAADFENANKMYEQGKFVEAAAAYEKLAESGKVSEAIYFNWGNALFKAGRMGRAIDAYQHAQRISPRDPDVRANLQFARNQVQGPTLLPDRLSRWLGKVTLSEWTGLASAAVWVWFLLLILLQWRPALKPTLKSHVIWVGVAAAFLCAGFGAAFYDQRIAQRAIIVAQEAVVRQAPIDESQSAFTLHDGAELRILDQKDQWLQVQTDPRRIGWVRKDSVLLGPAT
jgi:tetratricopeptide (TPR) repeat protein